MKLGQVRLKFQKCLLLSLIDVVFLHLDYRRQSMAADNMSSLIYWYSIGVPGQRHNNSFDGTSYDSIVRSNGSASRSHIDDHGRFLECRWHYDTCWRPTECHHFIERRCC